MHRFLKKHFALPFDAASRTSDVDLLRRALNDSGYTPIEFSHYVLKRDYSVIRESAYDVTATLLWDGTLFHVCKIESGDRTADMFGIAVDLGSTTVVARAVDLKRNTVLAEASVRNRQRQYGDDILSRIFYGHADPAHIDELQSLTADSINDVCEAVCRIAGINLSDVCFMALAGNTTMTHFLLGLDAFCVFHAPFVAHVGTVEWIPDNELNLAFPGYVYCFPSAANYLGGDIISGILSTGMPGQDELSLFIDIGTNGEMVIGNREFLIGGAGAAGPALEAGISKSGMRAKDGAIDSIHIENGQLTFTVIGGGKPEGICGSGIADLLAQMLLAGWIDFSGKLQNGVSSRIVKTDISDDGEAVTVLAVAYATAEESASGQALLFTQHDIEEFTHSKAAAHTMVVSLLRESGLSLDEVDHVYLAGAFGKHMNLESAITIGMYPDIPRERFVPVGNSSLQGATDFLFGKFSAVDANRCAESIYFLEFAMQNDFLSMMSAASFYPHTDLDAYPSVVKKLQQLRHRSVSRSIY